METETVGWMLDQGAVRALVAALCFAVIALALALVGVWRRNCKLQDMILENTERLNRLFDRLEVRLESEISKSVQRGIEQGIEAAARHFKKMAP